MARPSRRSVPIKIADPGLSLVIFGTYFFAESKCINIAIGFRKQIMKFVLDEDDVILINFGF